MYINALYAYSSSNSTKELIIFSTLKRCSGILLLVILAFTPVFGQHEDKVMVSLPSPNNLANALNQNVNVDFYKGQPQVNLPLYTLESAGLSVPVSLSYKASGIKLHDYASFVGMNWSLQAGGSIIRIVRGIPDEFANGYIGKNNTGAEINSEAHTPATRATKIANGEWDGEPDLFILTTPYESASFVFDENKIPVFTQPTKMTVTMLRPNGPDDFVNIHWQVVDERGTTFIFGNSTGSRETVDGATPYISAWYLNSMQSFNKTDEITFLYIAGSDITTYRYAKVKINYTNSCGSAPPPTIVENSNPVTYKAPKYLYQVIGKQGKIIFNYTADRLDLTSAYRLVSMDLYGGNSLLKRILLRHDYIRTPSSNSDLNRLSLKDIYIIGYDLSASMKLYGFKYYNNPLITFPARNSGSFDHWGYHNNNTAATPYPPEANKEPDLEKTKQFSLSEIEYGIGGKTLFEYELNMYFDDALQMNRYAGGLRVKSISEIDNEGKAFLKQFQYTTEDGKSSGQHFLRNFKYSKVTTNFIFPSNCTVSGEGVYNTVLFNQFDLTGVALGYSRVKVINPDGGSEIYRYHNFSDYPDDFSISNASLGTTYSIDNFRQFGYPTSYAYKRGLLYNKSLVNAAGNTVQETIYEYQSLAAEQRKARGVSITLEFTWVGGQRWYQTVYYHVRDIFRMVKETERTYSMENPSAFLTAEKSYSYSPDGTLLREVIHNTSKGLNYSQKYYYPANRDEINELASGEYAACGNMLNQVIPIREEKISYGGNKEIHHYSYGIITGVQQEPKTLLTGKQFSLNGSPFRQEMLYAYDLSTGFVESERSNDGVVKTYIYGPYSLLKAEITNAVKSEVFYENFESHHQSAGAGGAHTGAFYYPVLSYQINFVRPNQRSYKLSYNRRVNNKWEYIETNYTTDNLVLTESYPIDDVRVFPADAAMTTYTHYPLVGLSSKCGPNNELMYYDYDVFRRLKVVRDRYRNVLTRYDYKDACNCPLP
ncbi:hypothetical protein [Chitinophaga sp. XS-30]|uniref:hypothetical protein n=1 Tax=Chitinophaga sp. XS-30 TaxID=2604421 RepID=UPI0011DDFE21|nr:hypothetical protein [Chitinophaga sp. XS-30]QEH42243.1 hypothetical protein FW415_15740 [Chitinophaga sp. XS-30]